MRTTRLVHSLQLALALAAIAASAQAQDGGALDLPALRRGGGGGGGGGAVKPALDSAHAVHQQITPAGGSLQLQLTNGATFILVVPANALLNAETVSLTAIKSIKGLPFTSLAAGVEIGPPGLRFGALASLAILPPQPVPLAQETTFGYRAGGAQFFLFPAATDQRPVRLDILHTGGYGIARGTAAQQATQLRKQPPKPEDQFAQREWKSNWQDRQALPPTAKLIDGLELQSDVKSLSDFLLFDFTTNLDNYLQQIATSCDGRKKWGPYAKAWAAVAGGAPEAFASELADIQAALVKGDKLCYDDATTRCQGGDPKQVVPSLGWWGQLIIDQGTYAVDQHALESCLTFDLEFDTLVFEQNRAPEGYLISSDHRLDTHTVVHFHVSGAMMPLGTGSAVNSYLSARWLGGVDPQCKNGNVHETGSRQPDTFTVDSMILEGNFYEDSAPPPMVDVVYSPGNPQVELRETCDGKVVNTWYAGLFQPIYSVMHFLEDPVLTSPGSPNQLNVYEPVPGSWKVPMGASLWANRVYMDSLSLPDGSVTRESTDLNLVHRPGG